MEAAKTYCRAFGAEITFEIKNDSGIAYEHCELSVGGEGFLAIGEAKNPCDIDLVHRMKWETIYICWMDGAGLEADIFWYILR